MKDYTNPGRLQKKGPAIAQLKHKHCPCKRCEEGIYFKNKIISAGSVEDRWDFCCCSFCCFVLFPGLLLTSSPSQFILAHFCGLKIQQLQHTKFRASLKAIQKLQVLPMGQVGHLPKLTNHMDIISPSPLIFPANLLAYESISQSRKP